jgi:Amt family ammonium transporter
MNFDSGDVSWLLVSSALVMLMIPGVALFYGGLVRRKNVVSTMMMSFSPLGAVGLLWVLYGYSLSFGSDRAGFIGGPDFMALSHVGQSSSLVYATTVPHLAFMVFQAMFAVITVALVGGAVIGRMKFSAFMVFSALWFTIVYCPVAHWVWGEGGWLSSLGALDFAGGTVVHINAGMSALALAMLLGPRKGFPDEAMEPYNVPIVLLGAGLLWFGWFGFNGGSALTSGGLASNAFVATNISGAASTITWIIISWVHKRPTLIGAATGAVAGLAAITPAAGFVSPIMGIPIGAVAALICYYCMSLRMRWRIDESLDVWAVHGMGGIWGVLATGVFANIGVNDAGSNGAIYGNAGQIVNQGISIVAVGAYSFGISWILGKFIKQIIGLRVRQDEETVGLDISQHGERAHGGIVT